MQRSLKALQDLLWGWQLAFNANRSLALGWLALSTLSGLAPMVMLLSARRALTHLTDEQTQANLLTTEFVVAIVIGATAMVYVLNALSIRFRGRLSSAVQTTVLDRLLTSVNSLPPAFFDQRHQQDLLHRARSDALGQPAAIFEASGSLIQTGLFFVAITVFLALQSWLYPLLLIAAAVPAVIIYAVSTLLTHKARQRDTFLQRMAGYLLYMLTDRNTVPELRLTGAANTITGKHADIRERLDAGERRREYYELSASLAAGAGMLISVGIGVWWMLQQYQAGQLPMGDLAISFYAFVIAHRMAGTLLESAARLYRGGLFLGDLRKLLDLQRPPRAPANRKVTAPPRQAIRIDNLSFRYPGANESVFTNLNLEIPANQITVLTGPNGRGKSTLLKLIAGLYQPDSGEIWIDEQPLSALYAEDWWQHLSLMLQDPAKFAGSLRENVELDRTGTADHWLLAQRFGQLDRLITKLPKGENTSLMRGLGGHDLSGGEWQRVALARAAATNSPLILLDEPTSSLDPAARTAFWESISEFAAGRTVVIASHDAGATGIRLELPDSL